jgi:hypothetical protein
VANFPTKGTGPSDLSRGESPSLYKIEVDENAIKADTEGGYEFRRPRSTRPRRKKIETGFIGLLQEDYEILDAFWEAHTTVEAFIYFDYIHGVSRQMRFDEFKPDYIGVGPTRVWNIKIKMSEI